jgi:hypothetical protein
MPLVLQHRGVNKMPLVVLVQYRGRGQNKMPVKPVRKIHAWSQCRFDAVYDLDPLIDENEADNAVAAFAHLPFKKDVEHHILTFLKRVDAN